MIDLKALEKDFNNFSEKLKRKKVNENILNEIKSLFETKKNLQKQLEFYQHQRNT